MATIATLSDVKAHLNITSSANDEELTSLLDSATELVREEAHVYDVGTYTETLYVSGGQVVLSHTPVVAVTSVTSAGEAITGTAVSTYGLLSGLRGWREVVVTYTAGTAIPQARLTTAVLMVAARLWETQRGNAPSVLQADDGATFTPGLQGIISEVRALLGSSALGTFA